MYSVPGKIMEVISALLQGVCLKYFFGEFLEIRYSKKWGGFMAAVLYGVWRLGVNWVLPSNYNGIIIVEKQILMFIILAVLAMCFYRAFHMITVFLIITFMAVSEISFFLAYMVLQIGNHLFLFWEFCFEKKYVTSVKGFLTLINITEYGLQALMVALFVGLLYISLKRIAEEYREKDYAIHKAELIFIFAPGMVGLLICILLRVIIVTVENGVPRLLYDKYPVLALIIPAILVLSLLSILFGVKLFQDMIYLSKEKNSRIILEKQIDSLQGHIQEMEHIYSGIRSMKHDMKNTLSVIMQLAAGGKETDNPELQAYLMDLNNTMNRLEYQFKTGNAVVDTLLNMKYHEAMRIITDLQMDADGLMFSDALLIQSYDIGIILGNALDNAIEACKKLRERDADAKALIRLSSFQRGRMLLIEIENSFDGNILRKRQSEFPATDKADKEAHGIGFVNMQSAAKKYHGAVDWSVHDKIFVLTVMLQNERRSKDES